MTLTRVLVVSGALFGLAACQTIPYQPYARDVKKRPEVGGIIALHTDPRDEDKAKAADMMKSNCGANSYKVTEEGEVVVGQTTNSTATENTDYGQKQHGSLFGIPVTSGSDRQNTTNATATTTQLKEWHINYECVAQAAPATTVSKINKKKVKRD